MIANLKVLTIVVAAMVAVDALYVPVILGWAVTSPDSYIVLVLPTAGWLDYAATAFKVLTAIVFATWIYMAGRNLVRVGYTDLHFSPAARIGWFFVPIANWFLPFQGMRELWNASHGEPRSEETEGLVAIWWAAWLIKGVVGVFARLAMKEDTGTTPLWLHSVFGIALAIPAILMIVRIARAQNQLAGTGLAEVFA